jgi:Na+-transporting NADH:ubiquinone oxidoreductase subunit NqrC
MSNKDVDVIDFDDWVEVRPKRRRQRKVTLSRALREAQKAGVSVSGATLTAEGVTLTFGQAPTEANNPWLAHLERATKQ